MEPGLRTYILKRVGFAVLMLVGVSIILFTIMRLAPGGPEAVLIGGEFSQEAAAQIRQRLGLDRPIALQYLGWAGPAGRRCCAAVGQRCLPPAPRPAPDPAGALAAPRAPDPARGLAPGRRAAGSRRGGGVWASGPAPRPPKRANSGKVTGLPPTRLV